MMMINPIIFTRTRIHEASAVSGVPRRVSGCQNQPGRRHHGEARRHARGLLVLAAAHGPLTVFESRTIISFEGNLDRPRTLESIIR